ncbi:hypothetical protein [uncultured Shewanella sp.]|uniref:hypothetical protein n=1 Tax=uncultured Shewanella sp. TaxID=173975 RepID=UPI0026155B72|nr:hypothetical protein [uncultured Shewanella sp.]
MIPLFLEKSSKGLCRLYCNWLREKPSKMQQRLTGKKNKSGRQTTREKCRVKVDEMEVV